MNSFFKSLFFASFLLLIASFTVLDLVSAQTTFFKDIATQWETGSLDDNTIRFLFAFIVLMLVVTVVGRLPGLNGEGKSWLRWVMAVVVTLLATAYLKIEEIRVALFSYSTLGFVLGGAVPFLLLIFFSYDLLNQRKSGITNKWVAKLFVYILWIGFAFFMLYRIINLSGVSGAIPDSLKYAHYILFLLAIFILLFMKSLAKSVTSAQFNATRQNIKSTFEEARLADEAE
ncbi:MAG: hypothetical protein FJZ43_05075, partial [Candidatus Staskawiczbacteria bacterium]|nr:hypothetical protein [Candidatus Staskawiczbacteria bacterium]